MTRTNGPDLTQARTAIEALMDDDCTIVRFSDIERQDAALNLQTLELVNRVGVPIDVYEGPCKFKHKSSGFGLTAASVQRGQVQRFEVGIPIDSARPERGDQITINAVRRSPETVDVKLRVLAVIEGTFAVQWKMECERWEADQ